MDGVHTAVPTTPPTVGSLLTAWTPQPVAIAVAVLAVAAYARGVARTPRWPGGRVVLFGLGVALWVWSTCGFLELYGHALFWVWCVQAMVVMLAVPTLVMAGQPLELARRRGARLGRLPDSGIGRLFTHAVVGPLLVPVVTSLLVFGPLAGWVVAAPPVEWVVQVVVFVVGAAIALPLVTSSSRATSLAVGLSLAVGVFELLLDAVPGIVLRLQTHVATTFFDLRPALATGVAALTPIHDQQRAGGIVWVVAELVDLPFLVLLFRQWLRADAREAQTVDTVLEAEAIARRARDGGGDPDDSPAAGLGETTAPWWESDPRLRDRYR